MDQGRRESLARKTASSNGTRRSVMRFLAGGTLAGLWAGLGRTEFATAKRKSKRKRGTEKKRRNKRQVPFSCGPDRRQCADGSCIAMDQCCPGQRQCLDGRCLAADRCCPEASPPSCGACEEPVCDRGDVVCRSTCQFEGAECCNGRCLTQCLGDQQRNHQYCTCECPDFGVLLADQMTCCPRDEACSYVDGWPTVCCGEGLICVGGELCT
jgi:hypothetical protein